MRKSLVALLLLTLWTGRAQQAPEVSVEKAIADFFEAFHARDSVSMRKMVTSGILMQTLGKSASGSDSVITVPFGRFLRSITSIPDTMRVEERLRSVSVLVDGNLAQAWTPYEFYVNGKLSHCGANAFHLFREEGIWKILHIIDTRRREGCPEQGG